MKSLKLILIGMAAMFFSFRCGGDKAQKVLVLY